MDLKMLFLGKNDEYRIHHTWRSFRNELRKHMEVVECGRGWTGKSRDVEQFAKEHKPDLIYMERYWNWENLTRVNAPKIMYVSDPHGHIAPMTDFINQNKIDMTVHVYRNPDQRFGMHTYRERVFKDHKLRFLPHPVDIGVFKDYGFEREYDIALLGRHARKRYPVRGRAHRKLLDGLKTKTDEFKIFTRQRPKRSWNFAGERFTSGEFVAREKYAQAVANCKTFIFDSSVYRYAVGKYAECMACNTLAVADMPGDGEELHYIPDWNFVEVNRDNVIEKIRYYVENESERKKIARRGYETARKYHSNEVRVKEFLGYVKELF